ncbi:MAG: hypothetical protein J0L57_07985 [Burkholderiales bacterium]|nr:hypothetical protein [Burkholderiales bacterium]
MEDAESVADWGERWLRDWCNEPGLRDDERKTRAWLAEGWRSWTLETVLSPEGWFHPVIPLLKRTEVDRRVSAELDVYRATLHALPVWRLFLYFRHEAQPVPEFVLAMFEKWGRQLLHLQHDAVAGKLSGDEEGPAILRALQLAGDRKSHASLRRLAGLEARRRRAFEIWTLRKMYRTPLKVIAQRLGLTESAAKKLLYEFEPGPRRRRGAVSAGADLAAAHRRMVGK